MTRNGSRASARLLAAAYEAGIKHYDVAPSYGFGQAEELLGKFRAGREDLTVTTKFGIPAAPSSDRRDALLGLARATLRVGGPVARTIKSRVRRGGLVPVLPPITMPDVKRGLESSLRTLGYIDVFLLHEATVGRLTDNAVADYLTAQTAAGNIGAFGVGSSPSSIIALTEYRPAYCNVVQTEWNAAAVNVSVDNAFTIRHRSIGPTFERLASRFREDERFRKLLMSELNYDVNSVMTLAHLMLKASLIRNSKSVILFSTHSVERVRSNCLAASDSSLGGPADRLTELLQNHPV